MLGAHDAEGQGVVGALEDAQGGAAEARKAGPDQADRRARVEADDRHPRGQRVRVLIGHGDFQHGGGRQIEIRHLLGPGVEQDGGDDGRESAALVEHALLGGRDAEGRGTVPA